MDEITFAGTVYRALYIDLLRPLTSEERADLKAAIEKDGIRAPILIDEHNGIIDGINRLSIAAELGLYPYDVPIEVVELDTEEEKQGLCLRMNTARRQMSQADIRQARSNAEKRQAVRAALMAHPEKSDRAIAAEVGVSAPTVSAVRKSIEPTVKVLQSESRVGADGRTINTARIGKKKAEEAPPQSEELPSKQEEFRPVPFVEWLDGSPEDCQGGQRRWPGMQALGHLGHLRRFRSGNLHFSSWKTPNSRRWPRCHEFGHLRSPFGHLRSFATRSREG